MNLLSRSVVLLASFALPLAVTSTAFATTACETSPGNIVTNCGFESGFSGWTVVDSTSNTYVDGHNPYTGLSAANLGSSATGGGSVSQTLTDIAGQTYNLSFALENEIAVDASGVPYPGTNSFGVTVTDGSSTVTTLMAPQSIPQTSTYSTYSFQFVGTGSDTIAFSDYNYPSYYDLDNVIVYAPTPEPSSLALMGTGALCFAEITRRKMKRS